MSFNAPLPPSGPSSRKIAIPRLQRTNQSQPSKERRRVSRACTACRSHKIKCTGDVPQCKHCETTGRECIYIMPRKDRLKNVTERSGQMAGLLKKLRHYANDEDSARIAELLEANEEEMFETRRTPTISNPDTNDEDSSRSGIMFNATSGERLERPHTESMDPITENLHETDQTRATGFVGANSEVQWLRTFLLLERGDNDLAYPARDSSAGSVQNKQVSAVTFYLDNQSTDLDFYVDPYELPTSDVAEHLLNVYLEKVHDSFPILPRRLFRDQCHRYYEALKQGLAPRLSSKWQAILNLVFAIGAKYSHLAKASWQADERDHLIYQARANSLAWNESTLAQHPDLPQIQVAGLLAFYYLSVGHVSRAWMVIGVALRFATALGLHVRNEDPSTTGPKREVLIRVWWSLYYLERQLSIITGRPSVIVDSFCSVPLPAPFSEQQILEDADILNSLRRSSVASTVSPVAHSYPSLGPRSLSAGDLTPSSLSISETNTGSFFKAVGQMCVITQSILTLLYSAGTMIRSPNELQQDIVQIGKQLDEWAVRLPLNFNFQGQSSSGTTSDDDSFRQRTLLTFQFCSAKILLTRPCLSGLGKPEKDYKEGAASAGFTRRMAGICVDAAKVEVDLLPDQPHPRFVYEFGPWWAIVHHLMQALAVFLLALSYSPAMQPDNVVLAGYCIKIIRWLRAMDDSQAQRAHQVAVGCYEIVSNRLSLPGAQPWTDVQMPVSGFGYDVAMHTELPGMRQTIVNVVYGSNFATAPYIGMTDDFSNLPLYATDGLFVPTTEGQFYDGAFYDQHH